MAAVIRIGLRSITFWFHMSCPEAGAAGESFVCGPDGAVVARAGLAAEEILYADVDLASIASFHTRLLFLRHRRPRLYGKWLTMRSSDFAEEVAI
jgi:predicted amidohydrolase